jgi:hypothetical protein
LIPTAQEIRVSRSILCFSDNVISANRHLVSANHLVSQYASKQYQALLTEQGFICSMSRRENCWESEHCSDAVAERFFLNLKM